MRKPRTRESFTTPPKKVMGKKKTAGYDMGGTFGGGNPKKREGDMPPRTKSGVSAARRMRLTNRFI